MSDPTSLDTALRRRGQRASIDARGMSDHLPMVLETCEHLGAERHIARIAAAPDNFPALNKTGHGSLGVGDGNEAGWFHHYLEMLGAGISPDGAAQLVSGTIRIHGLSVATCAGHGVIRTHHALRSYQRRPSEIRVRELASALASWTAHHHTLPAHSTQRCADRATAGVSELNSALELITPAGSRGQRIVAELAGVRAPVWQLACTTALPTPPDECTATVAHVALEALRPASGRTALVHAVTAAAAVNALCVHLDNVTAQRLAAESWLLLCGLWAVYGSPGTPPGEPVPVDEFAEIALCGSDPHRIKLAGACTDLDGAVDHATLEQGCAALLYRVH